MGPALTGNLRRKGCNSLSPQYRLHSFLDLTGLKVFECEKRVVGLPAIGVAFRTLETSHQSIEALRQLVPGRCRIHAVAFLTQAVARVTWFPL